MEIMETIQATADVSRESWETISREGEIVWHHGASRGAGNSGKAARGFYNKAAFTSSSKKSGAGIWVLASGDFYQPQEWQMIHPHPQRRQGRVCLCPLWDSVIARKALASLPALLFPFFPAWTQVPSSHSASSSSSPSRGSPALLKPPCATPKLLESALNSPFSGLRGANWK